MFGWPTSPISSYQSLWDVITGMLLQGRTRDVVVWFFWSNLCERKCSCLVGGLCTTNGLLNTVFKVCVFPLINTVKSHKDDHSWSENTNYTILPLDYRNQESTQIPGFCNPMVKWYNWHFLWSKIEPHTDWTFVTTGLYFLLPIILINLQVLGDSGGMIALWLNRVYLETLDLNPRISIFDQRKS
jgi:hypothetical protein